MARARLNALLDHLPHRNAAERADGGETPMAAVDHAWLRMDHPTNLMVVNALLWLRDPLDAKSLVELLSERISWIPRMQEVPRGRAWAPVEVAIEDHVHTHMLPAALDERELQRRIGALVSAPLPDDRPLWSFHLLQAPDAGTLVLTRVHHCIGDGIAQLLLLLALTDAEPEPGPHPLRELFLDGPIELARRYVGELMPRGMKLLLRGDHLALAAGGVQASDTPATAPTFDLADARTRAQQAVGMANSISHDLASLILRRPDSPSLFRGALTPDKLVAWSAPLDVEELRTHARALDLTINDLLVAALCGGLRRYTTDHGRSPHRVELRAAVPINLRNLAEMRSLGNRFGLVFLELPLGLDDVDQRVREVQRRMQALKHSVEPLVTWGLLELMGHGPAGLEDAVMAYFAERVSCVMTNVPGPEQPLFLAGREIESLMFWVPQSGRVGLGLSICSYAGALRFGVAVEASLVSEPTQLVACIMRELEAIRALTLNRSQ